MTGLREPAGSAPKPWIADAHQIMATARLVILTDDLVGFGFMLSDFWGTPGEGTNTRCERSTLLHHFCFRRRTPHPVIHLHAFGHIHDDGQTAAVADEIGLA